MAEFVEIDAGTPLYDLELQLRDELLRQPLGLSIFDEDLNLEWDQRHFGLLDASDLIACVVAVPVLSSHEVTSVVKLRQMAVAQTHQGRGVGTLLLQQVEQTLAAEGFKEIQLAARVTAVGFYRKAGYETVGDEFISVTLPHILMRKELVSSDDAS